MDDEQPVEQIGRYVVVARIGSGGFATVYRVRDSNLDREVALKVMRPLLLSDPSFVKRFEQEARVVANLDHAHIVPIYDYGDIEDRLCLVMKLLPGGSLGALIRKGPLPWEQVVRLTTQIAAALDYAHERGLVHRDIKPENVLLDDEGNAVLADFGLVRALESGRLTTSLSGGVLGTPAYVAPEVWNGDAGTRSTDVYGLACLVYEMITGAQLFDAPTPPATMTLHFRPPQFPEAWPEGTPPGIESVLRQALAHEPGERYPSAGAFAAALEGLEADPLAEPYAALEAAIAGEKWNDAVALGETIVGRAPGYRNARALLAQATAARVEAENATWAAQWQAEAEDALEAGDWQRALTAAQRWQGFAPQDDDAAAALARAQEFRDAATAPVEVEPEMGAAETVVEVEPEGAEVPTTEDMAPVEKEPEAGVAETVAEVLPVEPEEGRQDAGAPAVKDRLEGYRWGEDGGREAAPAGKGSPSPKERLEGYRWGEIDEAGTRPAPAPARPLPERLKQVPWWGWAVVGVVVVGIIYALSRPGPEREFIPEPIVTAAVEPEEVLVFEAQEFDNDQIGLSFSYPVDWDLMTAGEIDPFQVAVATDKDFLAAESDPISGAVVAFKIESIDEIGDGPLDELLRGHPFFADVVDTEGSTVIAEPVLTEVNGVEAAAASVEYALGPSGDTPGVFFVLLRRFEDRYLLSLAATTIAEQDEWGDVLDGIFASATLSPPAPLVAEGSVGPDESVSGDVEPITRQGWTLFATAGEVLDVVVTPDEQFDVMVDVLGADGDSILDGGEVDNGSSGDAETATAHVPEDGEYLVVVRGYQGSSGSYTLDVSYHEETADGDTGKEEPPEEEVVQELPPFEPMSLENPAGCDSSSRIEAIHAVDRYKVAFHLCQPDGAFLTKLAMPAFGIASDEQLEATGGTGDLLTGPAGTGPYRVEEWVPGDAIVFTRNDAYWGEPAHAETLVFRWTEPAGRLAALQSGEADGIEAPDNTDAVAHDSGLQLETGTRVSTLFLGFDNTVPPFDDQRVRQALAIGIDRQSLVDNYMPAGSELATHFSSCQVPFGCEGDDWWSFDVELARQLLAEAGYPDGFSMNIYVRDVFRNYLPAPVPFATELQAQLANNLGIGAEIQVLDTSGFFDLLFNGTPEGIFVYGWMADYPHPASTLSYLADDFGLFGELNPEISGPLDEARQSLDSSELYATANSTIKELVPAVPIGHVGTTAGFQSDVEGAYASAVAAEQFAHMDPGGRDVFMWMQGNEPSSLYCAEANGSTDVRACSQVMERLVTFDGPDPVINPGLAHGWDLSEDGLVWTFYLQEGVTFHDGSLFDANDVVMTFTAALDPNHPLHTGSDGDFTYYAFVWGLFEGVEGQ